MNAKLSRLIAAARKAYAPAPALPSDASLAPFGFSTRVVARWRGAQKREPGRTWEGLCWWGAAASVMICLLVFVQQHQTEPTAFELLLNVEAGEALELF